MRTLLIASISVLVAFPAAATWEVTIDGRATPGTIPYYQLLVDGTYSGVALAYLQSLSGEPARGSALAVTAEGERHVDADFGLVGRLDLARDYNPNWIFPNHFVWPDQLDLSTTDGVTVEYHGRGGMFVGVVAPGTPQSGGNLQLSDVYFAELRGRVRLECTRVE